MDIMVAQVEVGFDRESSRMAGQQFMNVAEMVLRISRNDSESVHEGNHYYELRGLPANMSHRSKLNHERAAKYPRGPVVPTWLTYSEATTAFEKLQQDGVFTQLPTLDALLAYMRTLEESGCYGEVRLVLWQQH